VVAISFLQVGGCLQWSKIPLFRSPPSFEAQWSDALVASIDLYIAGNYDHCDIAQVCVSSILIGNI
jgi:hypothetical protein